MSEPDQSRQDPPPHDEQTSDPAAPDTQPPAGQPPKRRSKRDLLIKIGFAVAAIVGLTAIWLIQRDPSSPLDEWGTDLDAALKDAKAQSRKIVVLFTTYPPNHETKQMARTTLAKEKNQEALKDFIAVKVTLPESLDSPLAKEYIIEKLPTTLLLDRHGWELNRRVGMIGEMDFRKGFLDGSERVKKPES